MGPADVLLLLDIISSLLGLAERNQKELTPEEREVLHARTRNMVAKAEALLAQVNWKRRLMDNGTRPLTDE